MQYQSDRFDLPDAELRCLLLFGDERYLTPKGIAQKLNVVKSRVTKIINGLIKKNLIQKIKDPEDSRVTLLSITADGRQKTDDINLFLSGIHYQVLSNIHPENRTDLLRNLEVLKASLESVKELMA